MASGCKILELDASTVFKVGPMAQMSEAEALCLVREKTSVPVPKVFNAYTIGKIGYIVMEKIPGFLLRMMVDRAKMSSLSIRGIQSPVSMDLFQLGMITIKG